MNIESAAKAVKKIKRLRSRRDAAIAKVTAKWEAREDAILNTLDSATASLVMDSLDPAASPQSGEAE